jgi:hypothetical protein
LSFCSLISPLLVSLRWVSFTDRRRVHFSCLRIINMPSKMRPNLVLWGVRMGFMSYGWDAGVLGGVLQTEAFQSAMKVRVICHLDFRSSNKMLISPSGTKHDHDIYDRSIIPSRLLARMLYSSLAMERPPRPPCLGHDRCLYPSCWDYCLCISLFTRSTDCRPGLDCKASLLRSNLHFD